MVGTFDGDTLGRELVGVADGAELTGDVGDVEGVFVGLLVTSNTVKGAADGVDDVGAALGAFGCLNGQTKIG